MRSSLLFFFLVIFLVGCSQSEPTPQDYRQLVKKEIAQTVIPKLEKRYGHIQYSTQIPQSQKEEDVIKGVAKINYKANQIFKNLSCRYTIKGKVINLKCQSIYHR